MMGFCSGSATPPAEGRPKRANDDGGAHRPVPPTIKPAIIRCDVPDKARVSYQKLMCGWFDGDKLRRMKSLLNTVLWTRPG